MAETPAVTLTFDGGCPDCGRRKAALPGALPPVGDDFDWQQRDYDSFRLSMLEELAARFPERRRWSPADMEVVLVEVLAVALDQLSDMLDRVHAEAFLETARRPDGVLRLLGFIGYDPLETAGIVFDPGVAADRARARRILLDRWLTYPHEMAAAKLAGPRAIQRQRRMVTPADYEERLIDHPLVDRASAQLAWTGAWMTLKVACICRDLGPLDTAVEDIFGPGSEATAALQAEIDAFHRGISLDLPNWGARPTQRAVLGEFLDAWRMAGQEVWLLDPEPIGILIDMTVEAGSAFYRSEIAHAVRTRLGSDRGGFFEPARLSFGEDLFASDVVGAVMALDGVEAVCLNRFKRLGQRYPDAADSGRIELNEIEVAVCDTDPAHPERGRLTLRVKGGLAG
jgi:hypothetical protein